MVSNLKIKLDLLDELFNKWVFWRWIFYGMWQGAMIFFVGFYTMEYVHGNMGGASSEMVEGQFVYMGVVSLVNAKILTSTSNYNFWSFFFTFSQTIAFVAFFWLLSSIFTGYYLYGMFNEVFAHFLTYIALAFMSGAMVLVDNGLHLAQFEIKRLVDMKERERQKKLKQKSMKDHAVQRERITNLNRKEYSLLIYLCRSRLRLFLRGRASSSDYQQLNDEAEARPPGSL